MSVKDDGTFCHQTFLTVYCPVQSDEISCFILHLADFSIVVIAMQDVDTAFGFLNSYDTVGYSGQAGNWSFPRYVHLTSSGYFRFPLPSPPS